MAWSWSHTAEGYAHAREQLASQTNGWRATALAEWKVQGIVEEEGSVSWASSEVMLNHWTDHYAKVLTDHELNVRIWDKAELYASCDNGGHLLWMCPSGCHSVAPDPVEMG